MELTTERLYIRPVRIEDNYSIYNYRSDPDTGKNLSLIPRSVDDISEFINKTSKEINIPGTWFQVVILERVSGVLVGDIGIHFLDSDPQNKQVEIGYTLDKNFRGRGYATEALENIIDYLFEKLNKHRITASIDPGNSNSIKLVERLGFRKEAHFVKSLFFHGEWVDDVIYAMLQSEWKIKKYVNESTSQKNGK